MPTWVLRGQASVGGHVDEEDVLARELLELDVLLTQEGQCSVLIDGAWHGFVAVRLKQNKSSHNEGSRQAVAPTTVVLSACSRILRTSQDLFKEKF